MKRGALATGLLAVLLAAPAFGGGKGPTYAELPVSQLGARPAASAKPKGIATRETIPGIKAKHLKPPGDDVTYAVLSFDTPKPATKSSEVGGCISTASRKGTEWDGPSDAESYSYRDKAGVVPVRAEKLVDGADGTSKLEITDAWFDTRSRGLRVIGRSTLALKSYATIPGGTRILVGRDEHAGKKLVQFVVAESKDKPAYLLAEERALSTRVGSEVTQHALGMCSHHRIAVDAGGTGESVTFELKAILPPLASGEKSNVVSDLRPLTEWERKAGAKDMRTRDVRIQLGVSQTSRDKDPVISVAMEWSGDETIERLFTDREATFQAQQTSRFREGLDDDDESPARLRGSDLF
ncbi:MAG: hypothetical protein U0270_17415 [Labilithrix sp.]